MVMSRRDEDLFWAMEEGLRCPGIAAVLDAEAERRGRPIGDDELEPLTLSTYRRGQKVSGPQYVRGVQTLHAFGREVARLFETHDVLLTSTLGDPTYVSLKGYRRCQIIIVIADGTTVTGSTITLKQATAVAGTSGW